MVVLVAVPLALTAACGSSNKLGGSSGGGSKDVTIVGQDFTEGNIMTAIYSDLLDKAGYKSTVKTLGGRDVYIGPMEKGSVQVAADYLSSMTEDLNRRANGANAPLVASSDPVATLAELKTLGAKYGLAPLQPAAAQDANAFAVTKKFASEHNLTTLSDLGALGGSYKLAAPSDCPTRPECKLGLKSVYGINVSKVVPLDFDSAAAKSALSKGEVQIAEVATTDATLDSLGLVVLTDDKKWQNAENLVPVCNAAWLKKNPKAAAALNKLSSVLTTEDLTGLIAKVDSDREKASDVAEAYLKDKGLI
ncbi:MAG TPA: ABC transporter substrate-binding protein [Marmoricola sp.]|nr:ABC transporter substrate-binding protein [Marmoricola sp.]